VNLPQKRKAKKNATKTTLPTRRNPKHKKDLDEGTDDKNFPDPQAVEDHVPTHVCNWAQAIVCDFPRLVPLKCQHTDCNFLVHHLCQTAWKQREGHPDTVARYCCLHHPQYKYQHVILGWEFQFLVPISGTPIGGGNPILFTIPKIPAGIFFEFPISGESENRNSDL
jgi:hypothetical protein